MQKVTHGKVTLTHFLPNKVALANIALAKVALAKFSLA